MALNKTYPDVFRGMFLFKKKRKKKVTVNFDDIKQNLSKHVSERVSHKCLKKKK